MTPVLQRRFATWTLAALIFAAGCGLSFAALRGYRAAGLKPFFYQSNFEPAVMMACGRGFGVASPSPAALADFLQTRRNDFDCAAFAPATRTSPVTLTANANWYYMYGAAAAIWRVTGISWTALDLLVALFAGITSALLFGLFRLVAGPGVSAVLALLLTIAPANLTLLLSLRDYSKAPFALAAILILAVLVSLTLSRGRVIGLAALYGAVVGIGYGFRGDLAVMVPFGVIVVALLLPGALRANLARNAVAAAVLLAAFFAVAAPVIAGLSSGGGCQYHFALLGLTTASSRELHVTTPLYRVGDHPLDLFGSLKIGDYASRVRHEPVPEWCSAEYDAASGELYMRLLKTFPADIVVRAYGSTLMILRLALGMTPAEPPLEPFASSAAMQATYRTLGAVTTTLAPLGVFMTLAALSVAWAASARLGIAFTAFVLFLGGYPAIRFEERHWFHLRFIPWWAAALVISELVRRRAGGWDRASLRRAVLGTAGVIAALAIALGLLRAVQARSVGRLIAAYEAAPTEDLRVTRQDGSLLPVAWEPRDFGVRSEHQGTDLVVVTLDASRCAGAGPVTLMVKYDVDTRDGSHDLGTAFTLARPEVGAAPTRVFVPVFWAAIQDHTILRFSGFELAGAPAACVGRVARVIDRASLPLWLEMQVPADWPARRLYETIEPPRFLRPFIKGSL